MNTQSLFPRLAVASALLTMAFASGCQTHQNPTPPPAPLPVTDRSKDGPAHHRHHHHHHYRHHHREMTPPPVGAPAPITHPGG